jgi:Recombinase.
MQKGGSSIASRLNSLGISSPGAYRAEQQKIPLNIPPIWTSQGISNILINRAYTGCLVMGKTKNVDGKLKRPQKVPENEWIFCENHHEPIIAKEQFDEVQKKLVNKRRRNTDLSKSNPSFIGEKLFCGNCGRKMCRRIWHGKTYYMCPRNLESKGGCPTRSISEENLRDEIWESVQLEIEKAKSYRNKQQQFESSLVYRIKQKHQIQTLSALKSKKELLRIKEQELHKNVHVNATYALNDYWLFSGWASKQIYEVTLKIKEIEDEQANYRQRFASESDWVIQLLGFEDWTELTEYIYRTVILKVVVTETSADILLGV